MKKKIFLLLAFVSLQVMFSPAVAQNTFVHPWQGKRVAYFGDSITDPRNSGSKKKWWQYLNDWLGIEPYVYAISGRQWNDIPRQTDMLMEEHGQDVDAILVFIGTNDYNAAIPIGEWFVETEDSVEAAVHAPRATVLRRHRTPSYDMDTYRGRINNALRYMKSHYPPSRLCC